MRVLSNEKLFELIKKHPIIYDQTHDDYKNCQKRDKLWHKIGRECGENGEELKKRWKSLRDTYAKHLRRCQSDPKTRKWIWADNMKFFHPYLTYTTRFSTVIDTESDNGAEGDYEDATMDNDQHNILRVNNEYHELTTPKTEYVISGTNYDEHDAPVMEPAGHYMPERNSPESMAQTTSSVVFDITNGVAVKRSYNSVPSVEENFINKRPKHDYDDNESILLAYAKTIKKFSPKRQAMTKFKIAQIIMEQELLHIEECEAESRLGHNGNLN